MIQMESVLDVADNSGAKKVKCVKVLGGSKKMIATSGDLVVVAVQSCIPKGKVKKGEVCRAVVVRTSSRVNRNDGGALRFDQNSVVLVDKNNDLRGTRVFGPVVREIRKNFPKIVSLAEEVL
ncbi:MAG TPA: 50S ribosomal protein L14 [Candidatus Megaira endosymbiont of Hartmannula sinica]|nr:50S ribosomal protein L14 [Candidatus Megaera endosymbiont of Hartmannula sinica]